MQGQGTCCAPLHEQTCDAARQAHIAGMLTGRTAPSKAGAAVVGGHHGLLGDDLALAALGDGQPLELADLGQAVVSEADPLDVKGGVLQWGAVGGRTG